MGAGFRATARSRSASANWRRLWRLTTFPATSRSTIVVAVVVLLGAAWWIGIVLLLHHTDGADSSSVAQPPSASTATGRLVKEAAIRPGGGAAENEGGATPVVGTHALLGPDRNVEVVYAVPSGPTKPIVGIALLLHACTHSALKFFSAAPNLCDECIGLSEELVISRILLERGYVALAVTSSDRKRGCWGGAKDIQGVRMALDLVRGVMSTNHPNAVPGHQLRVVAVGASSGGRFAAQVAASGIADAAIVMVMGLGDSLRSRLIGMMHTENMSPPPIYLAPMTRDERTARAVRKDWEVMSASVSLTRGRRDGETYPVILDEGTCVPLPVTAPYLHGRVPALGLSEAKAIVDSLYDAGHLVRATGLLQNDPTRSDWRAVLHRECGGGKGEEDEDISSSSGNRRGCLRNQPLGPGKSPLAKALHRAWAFHEYCSEAVPPALDYIERSLKATVADEDAS